MVLCCFVTEVSGKVKARKAGKAHAVRRSCRDKAGLPRQPGQLAHALKKDGSTDFLTEEWFVPLLCVAHDQHGLSHGMAERLPGHAACSSAAKQRGMAKALPTGSVPALR